MASERERILDKIKKCLRLSKSSNEHEAAAALRQARKLMEQMQITEAEVAASEASESRAPSGSSTKPVSWETSLADVVAKTIGCSLIFCGCRNGKGKWAFIGCDGAEQIASYAFVALLRHLKRCRAEYISTALRRCKPASKRRRADVYCLGWISTVRSKVEPLVLGEAQRNAIAAYEARNFVTEAVKPLQRGDKIKGRSLDDFYNGRRDGHAVDLRRPLNGGAEHDALSGGQ